MTYIKLKTYCVFWLLVSQLAFSSEFAQLKKIRYWSSDDYVRVVLYLDKETPHKLFRLKKEKVKESDRFVVDLYNTDVDVAVKDQTINKGFFKRIRFGKHDNQTLRVVLDLELFNSQSIQKFHEPYRIVLDFYKEAPAERAIREKLTEAQKMRDTLEPSPPPKKRSANMTTIVLDPGHGGRDPGTIGKNGTMEKDITLKIARKLKKLISEQLKINVVLTRNDDTYLDLEERTAIANEHNGDLFISIHLNSSPMANTTGIETFYLDLTTDRATRRLAARENLIQEKDIVDYFKLNLVKVSEANQSATFATDFHNGFVKTMDQKCETRDLGVKKALFYVLWGARMPSILTEVGFLSNKKEEKQFNNDAYLNSVCEAMTKSLKDYIKL